MCLQLFVVLGEKNRVSAERLANVSGLRVEKLKVPVKGALWFSVDGGCSCSLMAGNADWNDAIWKLNPAVLPGLAAAVDLLIKEVKSFTFQAYWAGDKPKKEIRVAGRDLLRDIRNNAIRNGERYAIGRSAV